MSTISRGSTDATTIMYGPNRVLAPKFDAQLPSSKTLQKALFDPRGVGAYVLSQFDLLVPTMHQHRPSARRRQCRLLRTSGQYKRPS